MKFFLPFKPPGDQVLPGMDCQHAVLESQSIAGRLGCVGRARLETDESGQRHCEECRVLRALRKREREREEFICSVDSGRGVKGNGGGREKRHR